MRYCDTTMLLIMKFTALYEPLVPYFFRINCYLRNEAAIVFKTLFFNLQPIVLNRFLNLQSNEMLSFNSLVS